MFLRMLFGLMLVFGLIYLNNGNPKGPYTLTYEIGLVTVGGIGLCVLGIMDLWKKGRKDRRPGDH